MVQEVGGAQHLQVSEEEKKTNYFKIEGKHIPAKTPDNISNNTQPYSIGEHFKIKVVWAEMMMWQTLQRRK